jgi:exopolyphosphatase/guanosine-5'-triphosphate,3'-diphosphate pyrophosphatase
MSRRAHVLAAVDLGSNSFHMVVARRANGQLIIVDRLREMVRLGAGVGDDGQLDPVVAARAIACLKRFGHRLEDMHADYVRVVGTSALRRAKRKQAFLERARAAIGHPIEIISGREEARLIYSGVVHTLPLQQGRRLVVDIGGGSTELIIGRGLAPLQLESLELGCVSLSERFFPRGKLSKERFAKARLAAQQELEPIRLAFRSRGWESVAGSSGTVRAIFEAIRQIEPRSTAITPEGLERLVRIVQRAGHVSRIPLASLAPERRVIFPGGLAILAEVVTRLGIRQMRAAEGAMREGVLHDLMGRYTAVDARERSVRSLQRRYHVDFAHAERVEATAMLFLGQVRHTWELDDPLAELALRWAARLHEIGLDVAHSGYHRHGAYLLENADLPGFAREEQALVAQLVRSHRRKLALDALQNLIPPWDDLAVRLILILRLAVLLHRNRASTRPPAMRLVPRGRGVELRFRLRSLRNHPLTAADLQQEVAFLKAERIPLRVVTRDRK